jgi:cytochrome c peroxidase
MKRIAFVLLLVMACGEEKKPAEPNPTVKGKPPEDQKEPEVKLAEAPPIPETPLGLPQVQAPRDNPQTPEKVLLGKQLFFDKRLSKDGSASCETCHLHEKGWTDGQALSTKVGGAKNTRHTPTLYNVGYLREWYWDGRAPTLEKQIEAAWKGQMGADPAQVATAIGKIPEYKARFRQVFGKEPSAENIPMALGAYVRTLQSGGSAWDKYEKGDKTAVSADAIAGYDVFTKKAQCSLCHVPPLFSDTIYHNTGVGMDAEKPDEGRGAITKDPKDKGAFKTPGLRTVTRSGPYFHDGSTATLEEAVKRMLAGGTKNPTLDIKLKPMKITDKELKQLMAFLEALDSSETLEKPTLPGGE